MKLQNRVRLRDRPSVWLDRIEASPRVMISQVLETCIHKNISTSRTFSVCKLMWFNIPVNSFVMPGHNHRFLGIKVIGLNNGIFWLFRTCLASFDHLIGEKTRMYFAKSLSDSIMNSYSLLPNITILIKQCTSMALQRI